MPDPYRVYSADECGKDGYPWAWHGIGVGSGSGVKDLVRHEAGGRCVRCHHPYAQGAGEWSPCDARCKHHGPLRCLVSATPQRAGAIEAQWRILTVHHLRLGADAKRDLRWWNLAALCQRCHLQIQGKVQMERIWPWPHSEWFRPYAAGWYAFAYLGEDLTREQTMARLDELLALELVQGLSAMPDATRVP